MNLMTLKMAIAIVPGFVLIVLICDYLRIVKFEKRLGSIRFWSVWLGSPNVSFTHNGCSTSINVICIEPANCIKYPNPHEIKNVYINGELVCTTHKLNRRLFPSIMIEYTAAYSVGELHEIVKKAYQISKLNIYQKYDKEKLVSRYIKHYFRKNKIKGDHDYY